MLKEYLKGKDIEFESKDVSTDAEAAKEMVELSGQQGVPVADFDGSVIVGFDRAQIDAVLREKKLM